MQGHITDLLKKRDVKITIEFLRIGEIDTMNEKYSAEIRIDAKWLEKDTSIEKYNPEQHWNPKLFIENALQISNEKIIYRFDKKDTNELWIRETSFIKGIFWERLELHNFPIDIQELSITITTRWHNGQIKLISDPQILSSINSNAFDTFFEQQKWQLYSFVKISEHASYENTIQEETKENNNFSYDRIIFDWAHQPVETENSFSQDLLTEQYFKPPRMVASFFCSRKSWYYLSNAVFLIFLITISGLTVFSINYTLVNSRLQSTFTLLLTSVSFKWVINRSLPTVSYLTILDRYAIICIIYLTLLAIWHSIIASMSVNYIGTYASVLDNWLLFSFSILFILIQIGFMIWCFNSYKPIKKLQMENRLFSGLERRKK